MQMSKQLEACQTPYRSVVTCGFEDDHDILLVADHVQSANGGHVTCVCSLKGSSNCDCFRKICLIVFT